VNLFLVFAKPGGSDDDFHEWYREHLDAVLAAPGWDGARRYGVTEIVSNGASLASYPFLAAYEVGEHFDANRAALRVALDAQLASGYENPGWTAQTRAVAFDAVAVDGVLDALPDRLYFVLTATPAHLSFEQYSVWYHTHLRENLEGEGFERGWRFQLESSGARELGIPFTHLALYEVDGDVASRLDSLHELRDCLGYVTDDWFWELPIAGIDAHAITDRVTGPVSTD
jgi:hypothetical protein